MAHLLIWHEFLRQICLKHPTKWYPEEYGVRCKLLRAERRNVLRSGETPQTHPHHHGGAFWKVLGSPQGSPFPWRSPAGAGSVNSLHAGTMSPDRLVQTHPTAFGCLTWGSARLPPQHWHHQRDGKLLMSPSCGAHPCHFGTSPCIVPVQRRPRHPGAHCSTHVPVAEATEQPQDPVTGPINHPAQTRAGAGLLWVHRC